MSEEVKGQFAEAAYGGVGLFADALGMTEQEFFKAMESGKLLSKDVLPKLSKQMKIVANTNGALAQAMKSVNSEQQRFNTALALAKQEFFDGGFGQAMAETFKMMSTFLKTTDFKAFGALFGGTIQGMVDSLNILILPLKGLINLFGLFFGENASKWVGYALGVGLVALKVTALAKAVGMLVVASKALRATPIGLAITALALGAGYALDKTAFAEPKTAPMSKPANMMAQQYSMQSSQQNMVVQVVPDSGEFSRAVTARIVSQKQADKVNTATQLV